MKRCANCKFCKTYSDGRTGFCRVLSSLVKASGYCGNWEAGK